MKYTRTPLGSAQPFDLEAVKAHGRIDGADDDAGVALMAATAAAEIEAACDIALLAQTITAEVDVLHVLVLDLPVGPVLPGAAALVELVASDGTAAEVETTYRISAERYPELHMGEAQTGRLRITYTAGFGEDAAAIPADLQLAINDHASRLYDLRGAEDAPQGMSTAAARIIARHRRVRA